MALNVHAYNARSNILIERSAARDYPITLYYGFVVQCCSINEDITG